MRAFTLHPRTALATLLLLPALPALSSASARGACPTPTYPPPALAGNATRADLRWQPAVDFDRDGCYNAAAVSPGGCVSPGLPHAFTSPSAGCRRLAELRANNVLARARCNGGWCAHLYDYYFAKDVAVPHSPDPGGHTHDWEHVVVWVWRGAEARYVAVSRHGGYDVRAAREDGSRWDGDHAKVVYHKDGKYGTHCFRFAREADDEVENELGVWFRGDLVSYSGFPGGVRGLLFSHDFGRARVAIKDDTFPGNLKRAMPKGIQFNVTLDEESPEYPDVVSERLEL